MTDAPLTINALRPGNRRIRRGMQMAIDVTGQRFGRLVGLDAIGRRRALRERPPRPLPRRMKEHEDLLGDTNVAAPKGKKKLPPQEARSEI
jgi:hypothetical protein